MGGVWCMAIVCPDEGLPVDSIMLTLLLLYGALGRA